MKTTFCVVLLGVLGLSCAFDLKGKIIAARNAIGLDITNFNAVRDLFNGASSEETKNIILEAAGSLFFAMNGNSSVLAGKSQADIIRDYIDNIREILTSPAVSWELSIKNAILGLSRQEFLATLGTKPEYQRDDATRSVGSSSSSRRRRQASALPKSVDWRTKGAVTPVKNQAKCGSCWAFAAVGALEGRLGVKSGSAPVLSEQNLIDCAKNVNGSKCCQGCNGGWMTDGYTYVDINDGISSQSGYPYEAKDAECRYNAISKAGDDFGFEYTEQDSEEDLMRAVCEGPVAVAVDANNWSAYGGGIFQCRNVITGMFSPLKINHGVVVVGYGSTLFGGDFWIVKNSWGENWGEKGYIRIARNAGNQCGIASQANYPKV